MWRSVACHVHDRIAAGTFFSITRCASGSSRACLKVMPSTRSKAHSFVQIAVASRFSGSRLPRTWKRQTDGGIKGGGRSVFVRGAVW